MSYICGGKDIATGIGAAIIVAGDGRFCFALSAEQGGGAEEALRHGKGKRKAQTGKRRRREGKSRDGFERGRTPRRNGASKINE